MHYPNLDTTLEDLLLFVIYLFPWWKEKNMVDHIPAFINFNLELKYITSFQIPALIRREQGYKILPFVQTVKNWEYCWVSLCALRLLQNDLKWGIFSF